MSRQCYPDIGASPAPRSSDARPGIWSSPCSLPDNSTTLILAVILESRHNAHDALPCDGGRSWSFACMIVDMGHHVLSPFWSPWCIIA